jgi:hypothetical protein
MYRSTTVRMLAAGLLLVFVLPAVSVALPRAIFMTSGNMAGGCHGHRESMPIPSHSCCYARPQAPARVQMISSATPLNLAVGEVAAPIADHAHLVLAQPSQTAPSPPPQLILRI